MAHKDRMPLVFRFGEVDTEMEEIEHKDEWDAMNMALEELHAIEDAALVHSPATIPARARTTIHVALMALSPSIIAALETTSVSEVPRTRMSSCALQYNLLIKVSNNSVEICGGQEATVHIYGKSITQERPHWFTEKSTSYEPEAIQLAAREGIVQLRHLSPGVNCRSFYYYPSREGYGRPIQVASGDHETDPALLHLVHYVRAQEALYDQVTLYLIAARAEMARLRRREAEPEASNPLVLFGRPIELERSVPATDPSHAPISPEELCRILGISSNGTVHTTPRNGHPRYPMMLYFQQTRGLQDLLT
ncbi:hypothetical protein D1007_49246 [Hordeum vulgare]|nr:hypothetical protein D1007_49246 [Hordeum vulgare]